MMGSFKAFAMAGVGAMLVSTAGFAQSTVIFNEGVFGTPVGFTLFNDFNSAASQATVVGSGFDFYTSDVPGRSVALPGNTSPYLSIGNGSATFDFGIDVRSFSFDYSTVDNYNLLTILYANGTTQAITGEDVLFGLPAGTTSGNIIINGNGSLISGLTLSTPNPAFEVDNLSISAALAVVPEPASWAMMVAGFGLMGVAMRRKRTSVAFSA